MRHSVIDSLYEAALDPLRLPDILNAWDDQVVRPHLVAHGEDLAGSMRISELRSHFERALAVLEATRARLVPHMQAFVESHPFAAALLGRDGKIMAANTAASERYGFARRGRLADTVIDAASWQRLRGALAEAQADPLARPVFFMRHETEAVASIIVGEVIRDHSFADCQDDIVVLLKGCSPHWCEQGTAIVKDAFDLTETELAVLRMLCDGLTGKEIADARGRSVETIKKQINSLLGKTGMHSQGHIIQLVTSILHVCKPTPTLAAKDVGRWRAKRSFITKIEHDLGDDRHLSALHYGRIGGFPILLLHGNTQPSVTEQSAELTADAGLQIIAPFKPGMGGTSPYAHGFAPAAYIEDCLALLDRLSIERCPVAGVTMDGHYAVEAALRHGERVSAVGCINTGAPLSGDDAFQRMPESPRRTLVVARDEPDMLLTPYSIAAHAFASTDEGRDMVFRLAYQDAPADIAALHCPQVRAAAVRDLAFVMSDPRGTVEDLAYWMRDWTAPVLTASERHAIHYLHGEQHNWLFSEDLERFCQQHDNLHATILPGAGQTLLYTHAQAVTAFLRRLATL